MQTIDFNGASLRYADRGSGDPIVFLHNGALSHRLWDLQLAHFELAHRSSRPTSSDTASPTDHAASTPPTTSCPRSSVSSIT